MYGKGNTIFIGLAPLLCALAGYCKNIKYLTSSGIQELPLSHPIHNQESSYILMHVCTGSTPVAVSPASVLSLFELVYHCDRTVICLDDANFHGVLVIHLHQLLKERDRVRVDEKDWVLNEALNAKKLQSGGTFRNVIARKLNEVIIPIFSKIIALIDRNYNLDLANPNGNSTPVTQFWLAIFRDPKVMHFSYTEMSVREQVPGMTEEEFRCRLPFSWLVREAFEAQWDSAKNTSGNSN